VHHQSSALVMPERTGNKINIVSELTKMDIAAAICNFQSDKNTVANSLERIDREDLDGGEPMIRTRQPSRCIILSYSKTIKQTT
jgi:hypothetical protein